MPANSRVQPEAMVPGGDDDRHPGVLQSIREKKVLDDEIEGKLKIALDEFKGQFKTDSEEPAA